MELTIDVLLQKMQEGTTIQRYIDGCNGYTFENWKIDTNISNIHPVLAWE